MADRPVIFSAPMIRALIAGRKSQTRRMIPCAPNGPGWFCDRRANGPWFVAAPGAPSFPARLRLFQGDRLWAKEACGRRAASFLGIEATNGIEEACYRADNESVLDNHGFNLCPWWKSASLSPIHMPRWASRLTLTVTDVRVERLQDISEADAVAEGITPFGATGLYVSPAHRDGKYRPGDNAYTMFMDLWNSLHGPDAWAANPWVAAISFTVEKRNIDALTPAREPAETTP